MAKNVTERSRARKLVSKLGLSKSVSNYFVESLTQCLKNQMCPADVMLTKDFYPINMKVYNVTKAEIETECRRNIADVWEESIEKFIKHLDYNGFRKLTIKKIMVLALIELYK